ncbi:hypothetical protein [Companilactobacillus mishanensis]|uniref:hypothetical protein n=1 Tax=Companilactobacillus mishanensis TaxID=2486008 RepID=UPI001297BF22|nr:hypothetical protein [Companilactobacillus mishanensis]
MAASTYNALPLIAAVVVAVFVIVWLLIKTGIALFHHPIIGILLIVFGILGLWNYMIIGIGIIVGGIVFLVLSAFFHS